MMNEKSDTFVFPGCVYFLRKEQVLCRFQASLRKTIDPTLLQQALNALLPRADFFRQQLIWEGDHAFLAPNEHPCLVHQSDRQPHIPEGTNGYLFAVSCADNTIFLDWFHFLTDGFGAGQFMTQLLLEYCNRCYDTHFAVQPLITSPLYSLDDMLQCYRDHRVTNDLQQTAAQLCEGEVRRSLIRLDKNDLVQTALQHGVKPFSLLLGLLCIAVHESLNQEELTFSFPTDMRRALDVPNALYNCVSSSRLKASVSSQQDFGTFITQLDADVKRCLDKDALLIQMAQQFGFVHEVYTARAPLKIKKRIFQMGEYAGGGLADFWMSYVGDPLHTEQNLSDWLTDFQVWVPPDGASLGIEEVSLNGKLMLCIQDKTGHSDLSDAVCRTMQAQGVRILSAETLPTLPV
jgi:hypothetical protein